MHPLSCGGHQHPPNRSSGQPALLAAGPRRLAASDWGCCGGRWGLPTRAAGRAGLAGADANARRAEETETKALATLEARAEETAAATGDTRVRTCSTRRRTRGAAHAAASGTPRGMRVGRSPVSPAPLIGGVSGDHRRRSRRGPAEDQAKASWRTRAGAMGGGSTARCRGWRSFRITSPCVLAAMLRRVPCWQNGQRAMSRANTRLRQPRPAPAWRPCGGCRRPPSLAGGAWG